MQWIAPSEKDVANHALEKRLWEAADQLRANSGLNAQQYSGPVLGLIFLRFVEVRFAKQRASGSGGMFVQSAGFVAEHKKNASSELSIPAGAFVRVVVVAVRFTHVTLQAMHREVHARKRDRRANFLVPMKRSTKLVRL